MGEHKMYTQNFKLLKIIYILVRHKLFHISNNQRPKTPGFRIQLSCFFYVISLSLFVLIPSFLFCLFLQQTKLDQLLSNKLTYYKKKKKKKKKKVPALIPLL